MQAPVCLAVLQLDEGGDVATVRRCNLAFARLVDYAASELSNVPLRNIAQRMQALQLVVAMRELHAGQVAELGQEVSFTTKSGKTVPCQISLSLIANDSTERVFVMRADDLSLRRAAEEQLLQSVGTEQREDFIATLTHDLKTPIVGANMVLTALLDGSLGALQPGQAEIIGKLKLSNQALLKMIQNLLEVYKYESGSESLVFETVDLVQSVRFCVEDVKPLVENKKLNLEVVLPAEPLEVVCDEYAIKRVVVNLLSNATKFTPEGGCITLSAENSGNTVAIQIKDTGKGIDPQDHDRLFQRFYQGEPGKRYAAGTGLGLYFCHSVIKAHGGHIDFESQPGVGTTFNITLPVQKPPA